MRQKMRKLKDYVPWLVWIGILAMRLWLFPGDLDFHAKGGAIWLNISFLVILYGYILLTALGLGRVILRCFDERLTPTEFNLLSLLLGMAALSIAILASGLLNLLNAFVIFGVLALAGSVAQREWASLYSIVRRKVKSFKFSPVKNLYEALLGGTLVFMLPLLFLNALTPAWDYDALMYHLEIPRRFLAEGRIYFDLQIFRTAYPLLGEMLFLVGLAFKLDSLAKLIHLTYAALLVLSAYTFGKRFFGREAALFAVGILVGTPAIPFWSTWVSVDFMWAVCEFWSLYLVILWLATETKTRSRFLILAGVMSGLAASIKYLSLSTLLIIAAIIAWQSLRKFQITDTLKHLLTFGIPAALVMSPWYVKNWLWTGNPVYPLIWGGWDPITARLFSDYLHSFGAGTSWLDYLLIPYNIYTNHSRFSTMYLETVHPALWLAIASPFLMRSQVGRVLFAYSAAYYAVWAVNSQVVRFLLPAFGMAALLAGDVIQKSPPLMKKIVANGGLIVLALASLLYQALLFQNYWGYFSGAKSTAEILTASVDNFQMTQWIQRTFQPNERALFLWDGRGYYCDSRCLPDDEQAAAVLLAHNSPVPEELARRLKAEGVTHLMINQTDANWFIDYHDPSHDHRRALDYFEKSFLPNCGQALTFVNNAELYRITCP